MSRSVAYLIRLAIAHAPFDIKIMLVDRLPRPEIGMRALGLELTLDLVEGLTSSTPTTMRAGILMNAASRMAEIGHDRVLVRKLMGDAMSIMTEAWRQDPDEYAIPATQTMSNAGAQFVAGCERVAERSPVQFRKSAVRWGSQGRPGTSGPQVSSQQRK